MSRWARPVATFHQIRKSSVPAAARVNARERESSTHVTRKAESPLSSCRGEGDQRTRELTKCYSPDVTRNSAPRDGLAPGAAAPEERRGATTKKMLVTVRAGCAASAETAVAAIAVDRAA